MSESVQVYKIYKIECNNDPFGRFHLYIKNLWRVHTPIFSIIREEKSPTTRMTTLFIWTKISPSAQKLCFAIKEKYTPILTPYTLPVYVPIFII